MENYYFENIEGIGNIKIDNVIFEMDAPIFFVGIDDFDRYYLCVNYDARDSWKWVLVTTTVQDIISMLKNKCTMYDTIKMGGYAWLLESNNFNSLDIKAKMDSHELHDEWLPLPGEYVDAGGEFDGYIVQLERKTNKPRYSMRYSIEEIESLLSNVVGEYELDDSTFECREIIKLENNMIYEHQKMEVEVSDLVAA